MGAHHTKDKGDLGTAKAHADLVGQGFVVLFPATEHAAFDLVAYKDSRFFRIQVKYRATRSGAVTVQAFDGVARRPRSSARMAFRAFPGM